MRHLGCAGCARSALPAACVRTEDIHRPDGPSKCLRAFLKPWGGPSPAPKRCCVLAGLLQAWPPPHLGWLIHGAEISVSRAFIRPPDCSALAARFGCAHGGAPLPAARCPLPAARPPSRPLAAALERSQRQQRLR
ncbi:hypothetical protein B0J12DRAFT_700447 [Macrophomina phaseolina]|uniref:Uncharacterized protein n=1 Tax=Macrophomina phaseolina TaxID=35725 RepID=A0ABQ8GA40_9PEZI|nr:hypothetical protein B0J12DRAFT_700447 [Macrophomina phaseolina]